MAAGRSFSCAGSEATIFQSENPSTEDFLRARVFEEPLVPIGGSPTVEENRQLAAALNSYARRKSADDFSSLTRFLERHPNSPWNAALLLDLGIDYYNTAHYSQVLEVWSRAWALSKNAAEARAKAIGDRAAGELAYMYSRLGRMTELQALLKSVENRVFTGSATEKIAGARDGLWTMQNRPEVAFRCGPLALHRIKLTTDPVNSADMTIFNSASTQKGLSLSQVAELSRRIGLNYAMAFREKGGEFVVPSVVHWKVGHYAAIIRREGDRYLLQDPTFGNDVWATSACLEAETSGYFLIASNSLGRGWRLVESKEGDSVWGKGVTTGNDPKPIGCKDPKSEGANACKEGNCKGMAVSSVHLMTVNLNLSDQPVGYSPPVGPPVTFTVRYNHRDAFQPATFSYANFGPKWTCDWISYITDNPQSSSSDVDYYIRGGGTRSFTSFNTNSQAYAYQQLDQTYLKRIGPASYEMLARDGSKMVFSRSDGYWDIAKDLPHAGGRSIRQQRYFELRPEPAAHEHH
jgi:hypothetical protein